MHKLVKYTIYKDSYFIYTSLIDESIDSITKIYKQRWDIETHFRYAKYNLSMLEIKSKKEETLMQNIYIRNLLFIINGFIENLVQLPFNKNNKYKINTKNNLNIIVNKLLFIFIYKKTNKTAIYDIINIIAIIEKVFTLIKNNRKYRRIRIRPSTKWALNGNRFIKR